MQVNKKAIDVVLLPPDEVMEMAIMLNKQLLSQQPGKIALDKTHCLPHISLAMGCVDENAMPHVTALIEEIASQSAPFTLRAASIHTATIPTGEKVSGIVIEISPQLQKLHETIVSKLAPYMSYDAVEREMFYNPLEVEEITFYWVKNYPAKSSFQNFHPHITLGLGQGLMFESPIVFNASTLALCHLGNYCTCRQVLASAPLGGVDA